MNNTPMLRFRPGYLFFGVILFIAEIIIALYVHDDIIRPHVGDLLVVMLIYCFLRSFINLPVLTTAVFVLVFAYILEILQHYSIVQYLGLQKYALARILIGTTFSWVDILAYTAGVLLILIIEKFRQINIGLNT